MPTLYHGTSRTFATAMVGSPAAGAINVNFGEGEFGKGFYTQSSVANANRRGQSIYGNQGAVVVLAIDDASYHALRFDRLTLNRAQMLNAKLQGAKRRNYTTSHDVIVGPLVYQPRIEQQKFQTPRSQGLLNGPLTQRSII